MAEAKVLDNKDDSITDEKNSENVVLNSEDGVISADRFFTDDKNKINMYSYTKAIFEDIKEGNIPNKHQIHVLHFEDEFKMLYKALNIHFKDETVPINGFKNIIDKIVLQTEKEITVLLFPKNNNDIGYCNRKIFKYNKPKNKKISLQYTEYLATDLVSMWLVPDGEHDSNILSTKGSEPFKTIPTLARIPGSFDLGIVFQRNQKKLHAPPILQFPQRPPHKFKWSDMGFTRPFKPHLLNNMTFYQLKQLAKDNHIYHKHCGNAASLKNLLRDTHKDYMKKINIIPPPSKYKQVEKVIQNKITNPFIKMKEEYDAAMDDLHDSGWLPKQ